LKGDEAVEVKGSEEEEMKIRISKINRRIRR
jgi:hypothetical protein